MSFLLNQTIPDSFISAEICDNEDRYFHENKLHYIFITDENTLKHVDSMDFKEDDTHDTFVVENLKIKKNKSNEVMIIKEIDEKITQLCNKRNIIIYVLLADSAHKENNFILSFTKFLTDDISNKYYSNIIIFNFINTSNLDLKTNKYNTFSSCRNYCLPNVFNKIDNSKKYFRVLNVSCDLAFSNKKINYHDGNKSQTYEFIHSSSLYNYKELNNLIVERRCSSGKLIQFTGTCWINAILNALLLPKSSRKYMIEQCKINIKKDQIKNKTPLYDIYKLRDDLSYENMLNSIIYNIFLKKERPSLLKKELHNNFILSFADKIKRFWASKNPNNPYINLEAQKKLLNTGDIKFGVGGNYNCIEFSLQSILYQYLQNFHYTYRAFAFKLPLKFNKTEIAKMKKPVINKIIKKDSKKYNLSSCLLSQTNGKHMICGFICDGKEYIYNSNMKVAIECNWSKYDYQNYIDAYHEIEIKYHEKKGLRYVKQNLTIYMETLIYTLETPDDIEYFEMTNNEINKEIENVVIPDIPCNLRNPSPENPTQTKVITNCSNPNEELVNGKCRKKCNANQTRNNITGRCNNITKTIKCNKPDQELVNGKCLKKCNENQTRRISTGRCVKNRTEKSRKT